MSTYIASFWVSVLTIGRSVLPYVGLILLILLFVICLALAVYIVYKLGKRMPIFIRHLGWRSTILIRRLWAWLRVDRRKSDISISARFADNSKYTFDFLDSFSHLSKRSFFSPKRAMRPQEPLYLVLGQAGSGKSTILSNAARASRSTHIFDSVNNCDVTWWRLKQGLALELNADFAGNSNSQKFLRLVKILELMCPARPVDGIILVLPASEFTHDNKLESLTSMAGSASNISKFFEISLPLYLVLSKADTLSGFSEFTHLRYAVDLQKAYFGSLYQSSGAGGDDALATLNTFKKHTSEQIWDSLSAQNHYADSFLLRGVLSLPSEISKLVPTLQYLISKLSESATEKSFPMLQCIAMTGTPLRPADLHEYQLAFVDDLFDKQIYGRRLAFSPGRAYRQTLANEIHRKKKYLAVSSIFIVLVTILGRATWLSVDENVKRIEHALDSCALELRVAQRPDLALNSKLSRASLEVLLNAVDEIDDSSLMYLLSPSSWASALRDDSLRSLGEAINSTFVTARINLLVQDIPSPMDAEERVSKGIHASRIEDLPSYSHLVNFLDERELLSASIESGGRLGKSMSYADLFRFLGINSEQIKSSRIEWSSALPGIVSNSFKAATLISPEVEEGVRATIEAYWNRILNEAFDQSILMLLAEDIVDQSTKITRDGLADITEARQLEDSLKLLRREAVLSTSRRLLSSKTEALASFAKIQLKLGTSAAVSSTQLLELGTALDKVFDASRMRLLQMDADGIGPLFTSDANSGVLQLSPDLKKFASTYSNLVNQSFMQPVPKVVPMDFSSTQYVEWSLTELDSLRVLSRVYKDFLAGAVNNVDIRLKTEFTKLAKINYSRHVDHTFMAAARVRLDIPIGSESMGAKGLNSMEGTVVRKLSDRAANLNAAAKFYRSLQLNDDLILPTSSVSELLNREITNLLTKFDADLNTQDPYAFLVNSTGNWLRSPVDARYVSGNFKLNLRENLVSSREYLRVQYVNAISPLLELLPLERYAADATVGRWIRLRESIDAYDKGNNSSTLFEFERYMLALSKLRDPDDCMNFLAERSLVIPRRDYFSRHLAMLDETVVIGCEQRMDTNRRVQYEAFATWFNANIAGHPPFARAPWGGDKLPIGPPVFERLIQRYREFRGKTSNTAKESDWWSPDTAYFIQKMDQILQFSQRNQPSERRGFNASSGSQNSDLKLNDAKSEMLLKARISFRADRVNELGADQIIETNILSGSRIYGSRKQELFQWKPGDPLEVQFRWANNSPVTPIAPSGKSSNLVVNERTAKFSFSGDWALMEMLAKHASGFSDGAAGKLLVFNVPTISSDGRHETKVSIGISPVDDAISFIPDFPIYAPVVSSRWSN